LQLLLIEKKKTHNKISFSGLIAVGLEFFDRYKSTSDYPLFKVCLSPFFLHFLALLTPGIKKFPARVLTSYRD
jgi:hypothetical protein